MDLVKIADRPLNDTSPAAAVPADPTEELSGFLSYSYLCGAGSSYDTRLIEIPESRLKSLHIPPDLAFDTRPCPCSD